MRQLLPNLVGFVILTYAQLWMGKVRLLIFLQLWVKQHNLYQYIIISEHILLSKKTKNKKQIIQPIKTSVLTNFNEFSGHLNIFFKKYHNSFYVFQQSGTPYFKTRKNTGERKMSLSRKEKSGMRTLIRCACVYSHYNVACSAWDSSLPVLNDSLSRTLSCKLTTAEIYKISFICHLSVLISRLFSRCRRQLHAWPGTT